MSGRWCVVVPSDSPENLDMSLQGLLRAHPKLASQDIIVVSRKIREPFVTPAFTLVPDPVEAFNFARRVNLGFAAAGEKDVVLMGDDVDVVTPDAFGLMAEEAPLRLLSPTIRGRVGPWWQKENYARPEVPFISFICVYIPRAVYNMVGPLEEGFPGYGYEDTDYCMRARRHGLSCGVSQKAVVEHTVKIPSSFMETFKKDLPAMEQAARTAFLAKHGGLKPDPLMKELAAPPAEGAPR